MPPLTFQQRYNKERGLPLDTPLPRLSKEERAKLRMAAKELVSDIGASEKATKDSLKDVSKATELLESKKPASAKKQLDKARASLRKAIAKDVEAEDDVVNLFATGMRVSDLRTLAEDESKLESEGTIKRTPRKALLSGGETVLTAAERRAARKEAKEDDDDERTETEEDEEDEGEKKKPARKSPKVVRPRKKTSPLLVVPTTSNRHVTWLPKIASPIKTPPKKKAPRKKKPVTAKVTFKESVEDQEVLLPPKRIRRLVQLITKQKDAKVGKQFAINLNDRANEFVQMVAKNLFFLSADCKAKTITSTMKSTRPVHNHNINAKQHLETSGAMQQRRFYNIRYPVCALQILLEAFELQVDPVPVFL